MRIEELIKLFDMLNLKKKVAVFEETSPFLEFCALLAVMLKVDSVDSEAVESYFSQDSLNQGVPDILQMSLS